MKIIKIFDFVQKRCEGDIYAQAGCQIARNYFTPIIIAIEECRRDEKPMDDILRSAFAKAMAYPSNQELPAEMQPAMQLMGRFFSKKYGHLQNEMA